ncbi:MAG: hypothetical protein R3F35_17760 [Myxococcota bacterium]
MSNPIRLLLRRRGRRPLSSERRSTALVIAIPLASMIASATPSLAAPDLVAVSPETSLDLVPGGGTDLVTDQDVAVDNLLGVVIEESLGNAVAARDGVELVGFHDEGGSSRLIVFDEPIQLIGAVLSPGDVARFDGSLYQAIFDASLEGIPAGVEVDALSRGIDGHLVFSFDTTVTLDGVTVADEDLVRFDGSGFDLVFDGSAFGVPASLDLDAVSYDAQGRLYVSFDTSGRIAGVDFADEDILEFDPFTGIWAGQLAFDASVGGSGNGSGWPASDVKAIHVPEPGPGLALGALVLLALGRRPALRLP